MHKVKLQILRQINHHEYVKDGDCSNQENEYSERVLFYYVNIPDEYKNYALYTNLTDYYTKMDLSIVAPEIVDDLYPKLELFGSSGCCDVGEEGLKHDLNTHDYRITVINAVIVDIQFL